MEWDEIWAWCVEQTSAWITLLCVVIIVVGFARIGYVKRKRMRDN